MKSDRVRKFTFAPKTREGSIESIRQTRELLSLHHHFPADLDTALHFFNAQDVVAILNTVLGGLKFFQLAAGIITLLVGGVGVMNIMLVVVAERTQEIGLRKAIGASSRSIFAQFLAESTAVCGISGFVGAGLGVAMSQVLAAFTPPDGPLSSPPILDATTVVVLSGSLVAVGIVAGVLPAIRAARIPPAEALRAPSGARSG